MKIAVIGSGVSGGLAARLLATKHDVTLFESAAQPGGHAHTVDIEAFGKRWSVDTGFMVFNRRTYPNFCRLLEMLEVTSRPSDMSFSVRCSRSSLEYQGSSLNGLFAQRQNLIRPDFWKMILDINQFNRFSTRAIENNSIARETTVGEFIRQCRLGQRFLRQYLVPMTAAIWSADPEEVLDFPAVFMIGFLANHGLLQLRDRPQWRTIINGSRQYVSAMLAPIENAVELNCPIQSVRRTHDQRVELTTQNGQLRRYDQVVFATHADQTLRILADATSIETEILESFPYKENHAILHTDQSVLPARRRAWASWNYHIPRDTTFAASVTYDLSRLQGLPTPSPILLTLNPTQSIDPGKTIRSLIFHHPAFGLRSSASQQRWETISGRNLLHFCGAYWGYGFHEDGVKSALRVANHFGIGMNECTAAFSKVPSLTIGTDQ